MLARTRFLHELGAFFLSTCIVLLLLLLVVTPAHSQYQMPPSDRAVELVEEPAMTATPGVIACLVLQLLFLTFMSLSYLRITYQNESERHVLHHHWWNRVRWHH